MSASCENWIAALFAGESVNTTEHRPALHMALRGSVESSAELGDVGRLVAAELAKMERLVGALERGEITGVTGEPLREVVSIGIGGSDLGAVMVTEALRDFQTGKLRVRFVSSIDGVDLSDALQRGRSASHLVHHLFQVLHHTGDHDQCARSTALAGSEQLG